MDEKEIKEPQDEATVEVNPEEILEGEEITDDLSERVAALEAELENEKKEYLFLRADFDNYRKRTLRDREELLRNAGEKVLAGLLPIADDFERGIAVASKAEDVNAVREGMELIYNKLIKFLADNGVTPMESTGKPFDADFHDAIASLPNDDPAKSGIVIDTTQRGYMINDKVLRHAKVAVAQ
ncbi:MAG: nucleotide exchange factor GrpE [Muribaculaceae bacterium]